MPLTRKKGNIPQIIREIERCEIHGRFVSLGDTEYRACDLIKTWQEMLK